MTGVTIIPYSRDHQDGIDKMMEGIVAEYTETIYSPQTKSIKELAANPNEQYWVVLNSGCVIGTVGIIEIENATGVLKRMMLQKEFRGQDVGISGQMLQTVVDWCKLREIQHIYLGTMQQFVAAQHFYERNGFVATSAEDLPPGMQLNPVDTVFYKRKLN